jgi:hypothetical protein
MMSTHETTHDQSNKMDNEWRPYTIPYTGSGAAKDESNNWVPSSSKEQPQKACPPPPHGDHSTFCAPTTGEDRENTAAKESFSSRNSTQWDDGPFVPSVSRGSSIMGSSTIHDRFRPSPHGPSASTASYANPGPLIIGDASTRTSQSEATSNTRPCHHTACANSDSGLVAVSHPDRLNQRS